MIISNLHSIVSKGQVVFCQFMNFKPTVRRSVVLTEESLPSLKGLHYGAEHGYTLAIYYIDAHSCGVAHCSKALGRPYSMQQTFIRYGMVTQTHMGPLPTLPACLPVHHLSSIPLLLRVSCALLHYGRFFFRFLGGISSNMYFHADKYEVFARLPACLPLVIHPIPA